MSGAALIDLPWMSRTLNEFPVRNIEPLLPDLDGKALPCFDLNPNVDSEGIQFRAFHFNLSSIAGLATLKLPNEDSRYRIR